MPAMSRASELRYLRPLQSCGRVGDGRQAAQARDCQVTIMWVTILCSFSTGLAVYCILRRVHGKNVEIAVRLAVREVEKEFERQHLAEAAKLNAKLTAREGELAQARTLVKLHETVPVAPSRSASSASSQKPATSAAKTPAKKLRARPAERVRDVAAFHRHVVRRVAGDVGRRQGRAGEGLGPVNARRGGKLHAGIEPAPPARRRGHRSAPPRTRSARASRLGCPTAAIIRLTWWYLPSVSVRRSSRPPVASHAVALTLSLRSWSSTPAHKRSTCVASTACLQRTS